MKQRIKRWGRVSGVGSLLALSVLVLAAGVARGEEPCGKLPDLWFPEPGVVLAGGFTAVQETSGDVCEGGNVTIHVTVDNLSCGDAGPFDVTVSWDDSSHPIQTKRVDGLPGCEYVELTFTWDTDGVPPGPHTIVVVADSGTVVRELNEGNNDESFDVLVRPNAPYVEATKVAIDVDGGVPTPGDTIRYEIVITNDGCADLEDGPGHEFADTLPGGGLAATGYAEASQGTIAVEGNTVTWDGAIPAGGSVRLTFKVRIDDAVPAGTAICNQGVVQWDEDGDGVVDGSEPTDDPDTPAEDDPTCLTVEESELPVPLTGTIDAPSLTEWGAGAALASFAAAYWRRLRARRTQGPEATP
ncbi:MAG: CARDB domain-containing protein [Candidatus Bipolaricaulota bacterium]